MSVYSVKGKGWRYDFILDEARYSSNWFKTKAEAREAEAKRREEIKNPRQEPIAAVETTPTAMGFLELINRRLDHVKAYSSEQQYKDYWYLARRWNQEWKDLKCGEISGDMLQAYVIKRSKISAYAANQDLRYLRALFNFGIKRGWITANPTQGIPFLPVEKRMKYIPSKEDVLKVIALADPETQDYLWAIKETMGRMGEINPPDMG